MNELILLMGVVAKKEPVWVVGGALYLNISEYELILVGGDNPVTGITQYAGGIDFSGNPISIVAIATRIFSSAFSLNIKDIFPANFDILFNSINGNIITKPQKEYRFAASSKLKLPNPFGLSNSSIDFDQLNLLIDYKVPAPASSGNVPLQKLITITGTVINNLSGSAIEFGNAQFVFSNTETTVGGKTERTSVTAFGLQIKQTIDPAAILESILSITIPADVKTFLPIFKPQSATQPIRLYKATNDFSYSVTGSNGLLQTVDFEKGFHLDQLDIHILGCDFLVELSIVLGNFSISAHAPIIDLGFLIITKRQDDTATGFGTELTVNSVDSSIAVSGGLNFFPNASSPVELDYHLTYFKNSKEFQGDVTYQGTIIGQLNPTLGFSWSDANGFRITKLPINIDQLTQALNWADQLKRLSNLSSSGCSKACAEIVDLAFSEAIQTTFDFNFKPQKGSTTGTVGVLASGSYKITVVGKDFTNIQFSPILFEFVLPTSFDTLASALLESLKLNIGIIAQGLWDNKAELAEVLAVLTLKAGGEAAACRLACQAGEEAVKKLMEEAIAAAAKAAAEAALTTLAEAAAAVVAALSVLDLIAKFISWLFGKTDEQKRQEAEANAKMEAARQVIAAKLTIPNSSFNVQYNEGTGNSKTITASWGDCPAENPPASGTIYFVFSYACTGVSASPNLDRSTLNYTIVKPDLKNGETYLITIQAFYDDGNGTTYPGPAVSRNVITPILATPVPTCTFDWNLGYITVNWSPVANQGSVYTTGYQIQLMNLTTNLAVPGKQISITGGNLFAPPPATTCIIKLYDDPNKEFMPDPSNNYSIVVQAIGSDPDLNSRLGNSISFKIQWGVGYMRVGTNFKID